MPFSTTILSLLIALFSVIALTTPVIKSTLLTKKADIQTSILKVGPFWMSGTWSGTDDGGEKYEGARWGIGFVILVANSGESTGLVKSGRIELDKDGSVIAGGEFLFPSDKMIIGAGNYQVMELGAKFENVNRNLLPYELTISGKKERPFLEIDGGRITIEVLNTNMDTKTIVHKLEPQKINFGGS